MSASVDNAYQTVEVPRDWFLAAIEATGSVRDCLNAVIAELDTRRQFMDALNLALSGAQGGSDTITDLGLRIKALENTLRFRLGILRPERPAAWFRAPAAVSSGPFATSIISEPVFGHYDVLDTVYVKAALLDCWQQGDLRRLPFDRHEASLWRTLLTFKHELGAIMQLPPPFAALRLDYLPDGLPHALDSRPLRAFLLNVRAEVALLKDRLGVCFSDLMAASERFWSWQLTQQKPKARQGTTTSPSDSVHFNPGAEDMRAEFKRRRAQAPRQALLTVHDMEALRFMGFEEYPAPEQLRQRYLSMAKTLHPDRPGGNDYAFKQLTKAYSHLNVRLEKVK